MKREKDKALLNTTVIHMLEVVQGLETTQGESSFSLLSSLFFFILHPSSLILAPFPSACPIDRIDLLWGNGNPSTVRNILDDRSSGSPIF
jgi:hypothetical protein